MIGPAARAQGLLQRAGDSRQFDDPYDALESIAREGAEAVVISAPRDDLPGLCRAARQLGGSATRLLALCASAAEWQVRSLGTLLDDYLIDPPTAEDIERALEPGAASPAGPIAGAPARSGQLGDDLAELIEACQSTGRLRSAAAKLVSRRLGVEVEWTQPDQAASRDALLTVLDDVPRFLVARRAMAALTDDQQALLDTLRGCLGPLMEAACRSESLHRLAITDHLTGAYNRRYFVHLTDEILRRASQSKLRVSLLLFDIDHFKRYNDTYGYAAGDEILRETALLIKKITRRHDIVARIGGDEFTVLFWDPEPRQSGSQQPQTPFILADRFRQAVNRHEFRSLGPEARGVLSISGGLASFPDGKTAKELLAQADKALKAAKQNGKNLILVGEPHS
jgi:diguanylate cyclase (GGDEF)-like protein